MIERCTLSRLGCWQDADLFLINRKLSVYKVGGEMTALLFKVIKNCGGSKACVNP